MKTLVFILIIFFAYSIHAQEVIDLSFGGFWVDFEDTSNYKYVKIDSNNIWNINNHKKQILYLDNYAIVSDTNEYYSKELKSSFQFRLNYEYCCDIFFFSFCHKYDFEKNKDGGIIETSYNNGLSWQNIIYDTIINKGIEYTYGLYNIDDSIQSFNNQPGFTGMQNEVKCVDINFWSWVIYEMPIDTMLLRFTFASDSNNTNNEGWILDDFIFGAILVGIKETGMNNNIYISPNPSNKIISINSSIEIIYKIEILTMNGIKILEKLDTNSVDITGIKPGIYIIKINDRFIEKLIIE